MSEKIFENENFKLVSFWGGIENGTCLSIELKANEFVNLTRKEVIELSIVLLSWAADTLKKSLKNLDLESEKLKRKLQNELRLLNNLKILQEVYYK